jgi:hypothetical protein
VERSLAYLLETVWSVESHSDVVEWWSYTAVNSALACSVECSTMQ